VADHRSRPPRGPLGAEEHNQPAPPVGPLAASRAYGSGADGSGSNQPTPPIGPLAASHPSHDLVLVSAWASGDLEPAARSAAVELVDRCSACAELASDLRAVAAATVGLPAARRPRDFFLTPADAERLRPRRVRRILALLAAPGAVTRPLATGLTSLGVAGLLLAALPGIVPLGGGAAMPAGAPAGESVSPVLGESPAEPGVPAEPGAPAATGNPALGNPSSPAAPGRSAAPGAPEPPEGRDTSGEGASQGEIDGGSAGGPGTGSGEDGSVTTDSGDADPVAPLALADEGAPSVLIVLSGSFLIAGLGLFALRWTGRRLSD